MYILKTNKSTSLPQLLLFYDTEAEIIHLDDRQIHRFKIVSSRFYRYKNKKYQLQHEYTFTSLDDFWDYAVSLTSSKKKLYIISHNQHYDFFISNAYYHLKKRGFTLKEFSFDSNIFFATFRDNRNNNNISRHIQLL